MYLAPLLLLSPALGGIASHTCAATTLFSNNLLPVFSVHLYKCDYMTIVIKKGASQREIKKLTQKISKTKNRKKGFDAFKYCGIIKFKEDPLVIQKRLRDEWE